MNRFYTAPKDDETGVYDKKGGIVYVGRDWPAKSICDVMNILARGESLIASGSLSQEYARLNLHETVPIVEYLAKRGL